MAKSGAAFRGRLEFERNLRNAARIRSMDVGRAMFEEMEEVEMVESMNRTPVDTGDLRDSHVTKGPSIRQNYIRVDIHVGDGLEYATRVHEDTEAFHREGQAKFLESTLNESEPFILRRVAARMKKS